MRWSQRGISSRAALPRALTVCDSRAKYAIYARHKKRITGNGYPDYANPVMMKALLRALPPGFNLHAKVPGVAGRAVLEAVPLLGVIQVRGEDTQFRA